MSYMVLKWAREQEVGNPNGKSILIDLALRANDEGVCWPGQASIAEATEISERTVLTWLQKLEEDGYIKRSHRQRKNGSRTSDYIELQISEKDKGHPQSKPREVQEDQTATDVNQTATVAPPEYPEENKEKENIKEKEEPKERKTLGQKAASYVHEQIKEKYDVDLTVKQFGYYVGDFNRASKKFSREELKAGADRIVEVFPKYQRLTVEEAVQQSKLNQPEEIRDDPTKRTI